MNKYLYLLSFILICLFTTIIVNINFLVLSCINFNPKLIVYLSLNLVCFIYIFIFILIEFVNKYRNRNFRINWCFSIIYMLLVILYNVSQILTMVFLYGDKCKFENNQCNYLQINFYIYFLYLSGCFLTFIKLLINVDFRLSKLKLTKVYIFTGDCSICMEELDNRTVETICKHNFHKDCIEKWGEKNNSCPLCRELMINV